MSASGTDAWALGAYSPKPGYKTYFTLHWNGSAWTTVSIPVVGTSDSLASVSTSPGAAVVWAAGASSRGTAASTNPLTLQNG